MIGSRGSYRIHIVQPAFIDGTFSSRRRQSVTRSPRRNSCDPLGRKKIRLMILVGGETRHGPLYLLETSLSFYGGTNPVHMRFSERPSFQSGSGYIRGAYRKRAKQGGRANRIQHRQHADPAGQGAFYSRSCGCAGRFLSCPSRARDDQNGSRRCLCWAYFKRTSP